VPKSEIRNRKSKIANQLRPAFIGLGSNLGDREAHLRAALAQLGDTPQVSVCRVSAFSETLPQGGPSQPNFLNAAAELQTELPARRLLDLLLAVEKRLGRVRGERWGPRVIDLDLLLYGPEIIRETGLQVPHPRMHERMFVLEPLCEIAPDATHPVSGKQISTLLAELRAAAEG